MDQDLQEIFQAADDRGTGDIHIMPQAGDYQVFFRQGKALESFRQLDRALALKMIARLKFLGNMDVGDKRRPQSGALDYPLADRRLQLRLSTIADYQGEESLVIRLLAPSQDLDLRAGTFYPADVALLEEMVAFQSGFILFSGPVSSGKTTTMYQLVKGNLKETHRQVITIEDPVEMEEAAFLQTQVNAGAGISYDRLVRQSLRHHPDIIIIGEIRDELTAQAAVRAALTGHLVLASIHAKNAQGVLARLEDLGISQDLLRQTIIGIIFQKILPRYCPACQGDCRMDCDQLPLRQKKAVLYDICYGESLGPLFSDQAVDAFNGKLRRAYDEGHISQAAAAAYRLP